MISNLLSNNLRRKLIFTRCLSWVVNRFWSTEGVRWSTPLSAIKASMSLRRRPWHFCYVPNFPLISNRKLGSFNLLWKKIFFTKNNVEKLMRKYIVIDMVKSGCFFRYECPKVVYESRIFSGFQPNFTNHALNGEFVFFLDIYTKR